MSLNRLNTAGLDFGTSNSTITYFDSNGQRSVAEDDRQSRYIPSMISCVDKLRIGYEAKRDQIKYSENTIFDAKRLLGKQMSSPGIKELVDNWPFKVVAGENDKAEYEITWQGQVKRVTPEEIVSHIIDYMCSLAEKKTNTRIENLVVTVPAHFDDTQRRCLLVAAEMTGRRVIQCLDEPTAAAISFSLTNDLNNKRVLVYDFGGGTFDVSIMDITDYVYNVRYTDGDAQLGGSDIDAILFNYIIQWLKDKYQLDISMNSKVCQRIRTVVEEIKVYFSGDDFFETEISIEPFEVMTEDGESIEEVPFSMQESEYNRLIEDVIVRTLDIVADCVNQKFLQDDDIDMIALIGGSSNICLVKEMLDEKYQN